VISAVLPNDHLPQTLQVWTKLKLNVVRILEIVGGILLVMLCLALYFGTVVLVVMAENEKSPARMSGG
jgi:hypothetical protein